MNAGSVSGGGGGAGPRGNRGLHHQQRQHELDEHGADTVLYYARAGDLEGVRRMVEADATQANYQRIVTPLMWAAYCGHAKVVRFLLECGAHIDQTEEGKGRTALYLASGRGHAEVVKLLLSRGANPTIKRKGGWCPLSVAASEAHVNVVRVLLAHRKVDVDSRDNDGSTALYRASLWGCTEAVRELLRKGADATTPGGGGLTPVAVAKARGYRGCIEALEDADRVYELAKARKLLRIGALLERLSRMGPAHLSTSRWYQDIPPYLRARLEGAVELPLPIVTFNDAAPTPMPTSPAGSAPMAAAQPHPPAAAAATAAAAAAAAVGSTASTTDGGGGSGSPSLWTAWLRVGAGSSGGGGAGSRTNAGGLMASTVAAGMSQAALASAPRAAAAAAIECELLRTPPRGHAQAESTPEDLAPAVAAFAVQELSYDTFLSLAEMLI